MTRLVFSICPVMLTLFFFSCNKNSGQSGGQGNNKSFSIYNAMQYQSMPDLTSSGVKAITLINETNLFTTKTDLSPDSEKIENLAIQSGPPAGATGSSRRSQWPKSSRPFGWA